MTAECIHGLGPASACTICNGRDQKVDEDRIWREFAAKYEGQCWICHLPIRVGELIAWHPDVTPVHAECRR